MRIFLFAYAVLVFCSCSRDEEEVKVEIEKVTHINDSLVHASSMRTYRIHVPLSYYESSEKVPLVIALHGGGGSGEQFQTQSELDEKADEENFIVVYPDGLVNPNVNVRTWNAGRCCGQNASTLDTDDVGFISALIDKMEVHFPNRIDNKRVYATGHSNGGMLSYRLADELSNKIAAVAPNAGNMQIDGIYNPARNIPVLQIISKLDDNVTYEGGWSNGPAGQYNPPIDSILNVVASVADCSQSKVEVETNSDLYAIYKWSGCTPDNFEVLLYLTEDGGHSWPGGNKGSIVADEPSAAFSANDVIWEFFQKHTLP
jgi:polyhydroxybutyrate depolymerase